MKVFSDSWRVEVVAQSEEQVKKAAELKLWLEDRILELQDEMARLRETLAIVDESLRASTFRPASEMIEAKKEVPEVRDVKRDKGGQVLARASITQDSLAIEPEDGVVLRSSTAPFKSFLLGKILDGMRAKDSALAAAGKIQSGEELRYDVEEKSGAIARIMIENYRERARLNEILSTVSWTFSRMLEK
jgi:hypothetical protein